MGDTVNLELVSKSEKDALRAMLDAYLIEHADLVDPERRQGDPTLYRPFDLYWIAPERRPLWIVVDDTKVGFALVNSHSPSGLGCDRSIAEFYVSPEYRRSNVGSRAARAVLSSEAGLWEVQVFRANQPGMAFWPRAIGGASVANLDQIEEDERVLFRFTVSSDGLAS